MMKRFLSLAVAVMFVAGFASQAFAGGHGKGGSYSSKGKKCEIMKKIKMICYNKKELGLTDEQVEKISDIKFAVKKDMIKLGAEAEVTKLDIKKLMKADVVDVAAIKPLVEKKYDIKKEMALKGIDAYAKAKSVLTKEQRTKLKDICHESWKSKMSKWFGGCKKGKCEGRHKK